MYLFNLLGTLVLLDSSLIVGGPILPFFVTWDTSKIRSTLGVYNLGFLCFVFINDEYWGEVEVQDKLAVRADESSARKPSN